MVVDQLNAQLADQFDEAQIDKLFHALADATRRDIVRLTLQGELSVSALSRRYPMSFAAIQKHVAVLERADLVSKQRSGREQLVSARIDALRDVAHLLDEFEALWRGRVDRMTDLLTESSSKTDTDLSTHTDLGTDTNKEHTP
jgi:DNA-binding transcriptional ArsR family regulator